MQFRLGEFMSHKQLLCDPSFFKLSIVRPQTFITWKGVCKMQLLQTGGYLEARH